MFSLNTIGLDKKLLNEIVKSKKKFNTGCFCTEYDVLFFKYQKNYSSQNIAISLILKTVHRTIFSLNAIGLEKKLLNEIVQSEKKIQLFKKFIFLDVLLLNIKKTICRRILRLVSF